MLSMLTAHTSMMLCYAYTNGTEYFLVVVKSLWFEDPVDFKYKVYM